MAQLFIFLISIAVGAGLRVVYFLQRRLALKTNLRGVTIALDAVFTGLAFFALFLIFRFLGGGVFRFFMPAGILAGFFLVAIKL